MSRRRDGVEEVCFSLLFLRTSKYVTIKDMIKRQKFIVCFMETCTPQSNAAEKDIKDLKKGAGPKLP